MFVINLIVIVIITIVIAVITNIFVPVIITVRGDYFSSFMRDS